MENGRENKSDKKTLRKRRLLIVFLFLLSVLVLFFRPILKQMGRFLILDEPPVTSDAIVVLYTGVDYYSRLIEAARLYNANRADYIVINGNRKSEDLITLENMGFVPCCPWWEDFVRILELFDAPAENIISVSAEEAYDTVSEAERVGTELIERGFRSIIVTTSKYHTRRAGHIWKDRFAGELSVRVSAAKTDPFDPDAWWTQGRQIRWVLSEYGAWVYYYWKKITEPF